MVEFDPALHTISAPMIETVPVVEYDAPASTMAQQVHAVPALVEEYGASVARATSSLLIDGSVVKVVHVPKVQVVEKTIEIPHLQTIEKIVDTPEIQTLQCTEVLDTAADLKMAPAERTLRIPLADGEGAIEELYNAMAEGFPAVLDEFIENFKPDGLSAVIDEHFEKFDEPDKKHECDEYVCGTWASEKGESKIFMDSITNRLSCKEVVNDSGYLHGWLDRRGDGWQVDFLRHG